MCFHKTLRTLGTATLLAAGLLTTPAWAAAPPPRLWMPLQSNGPAWQNGMLQPLVDGKIEEPEYANGVKADINDFTNSVPNGNGLLYLSMSDDVSFTAQQCRKPGGAACEGGRLFIGFKIHAASPALGTESGSVTIFLDTQRQKTLDHQSCVDANSLPTTKPGPEDRKIQILYTSVANQAALTLTVKQFKGNCTGWVDITPPANDPMHQSWPVQASAQEVVGANGNPSFLTFEASIHSEPQVMFPSNPIVEERLVGLGIRHMLNTLAAVVSFGSFPSIFNKPPTDLDTWSWETLDLSEPQRIDLAMTAYNVGQLQITDDGGQGEAEDFAQLVYKNDVVCMVEQMNGSERDEVVAKINQLRANDGLAPMTPVYPEDGEAPNNMILAAGPIMDADWVLYGDLPEVSAYCAEESDGNLFTGGECTGDGAGYKGIVWARIGVKKSKPTRHGKPETWFSDQFVDVFCTHTQADYLGDGEFAHSQSCLDSTLSSAVDKNCVKGPNGPGGNPWSTNIREEQWKALRNWANKKRAGGNGAPNGLDRPAFILGDLNQIGPKAIPFGAPNQSITNWINATGGQSGFGSEYAAMRSLLGNLQLSVFDQANGWAWDLYDLLARDDRGTWIGNGTESAVPATSANDCITPGQFTGYDTLTELPKEARVDYILVMPAQGSFPFYSVTGPTANPAEPLVTIEANPGSWYDGLGCASDHAQVSTRLALVQTGLKAGYNPNKKHKVTYRVSHLWDFNDADGGDTDWFVDTDDFEIESLTSGNVPIQVKRQSFSDDATPDGVAVPVTWSDAVILSGGEKARMGVWVSDHDSGPNDVYDGSSFGPGVFLGPHFEFDSAYPGTFRLIGDFSTVGGNLLGTADASSSDPDGSCALGCLGVQTQGNGQGVASDEDVRVTQSIQIEEVP